MARGRPRKSGNRHPNGKLKLKLCFDRGSEWVQSRIARFGTDYNSALDRAYSSGLLGEEAEAQDRYLAGKRFARTYNLIFGGDTYRCALDTSPHGAGSEAEPSEYDAKEREWLLGVMRDLDAAGLRPWLDQLISRLYTDTVPPWLDRLVAGGENRADSTFIRVACHALGHCFTSPNKMSETRSRETREARYSKSGQIARPSQSSDALHITT